MEEITFFITSSELDKLFDLKDQEGMTNLSANEYAKILVLRELRRHHVKQDKEHQ